MTPFQRFLQDNLILFTFMALIGMAVIVERILYFLEKTCPLTFAHLFGEAKHAPDSKHKVVE